MKIRVYYEDTDAGGIVYHSRYLNFCERARSELFFRRGMLPAGEEEKSGFVVRHIDADFTGMAWLGDLLEVETVVIERSRSTLLLRQCILRKGREIFSMRVKLVYIEGGRLRRIPAMLMEVIEESLAEDEKKRA